MNSQYRRLLPLPRGVVAQTILLLFLFMPMLFNFNQVNAQSGAPVISLSLTSGDAGQLIEIQGSGFTPGGHTGSILYDGELVDTFEIPGPTIGGPPGGSFTVPFFIPLTSTAGIHEIEVCSLNPCATGEFEQRDSARFNVTATAPEVSGTVAYVHNNDRQAAAGYAGILGEAGYDFKAIPLSDVLLTDFNEFSLIIIGNDTGNPQNGTWGSERGQAQHIASSQLPIVGVGVSGSLYFNQIQPSLGLNNAQTSFLFNVTTNDLEPANFYQKPYGLIDVQRNPVLTLFDNTEVETVLLKPVDDTTPERIGFADTSFDFLTIAADDCRLLWSYGGTPEQLSAEGRALFVNAVFNTSSRSCQVSPFQLCSALERPELIPMPSGMIDFDGLEDSEISSGTDLSSLFTDLYGVSFSQHPDSQVVADVESAGPHSPPNVALNQPLNLQIGSDDIPLKINFDGDKSHVGFYFGANDTLSIEANLRAYDRQGQIICTTSRSPVPLGHTTFLGIRDPKASIASVEFDYGGSPVAESIDDLIFAPYSPPTPPKRIRVCMQEGKQCLPAPGAILHTVDDGLSTGRQIAGTGGFVDAVTIPGGTQLWALIDVTRELSATTPISNTDRYSIYFTSEVVTVSDNLFNVNNVLNVPVSPRRPVMLYHAQISSEWVLDSDYKSLLATRVISGSNYLYNFTDGQFVLGNVTVFQDLENWPSYDDAPQKADMRLYLNNNMRPEAEAGGVVSALISDTVKADVAYRPGFMMMGSEWNRFHQPPGDPKIPELLQEYFPGEPESILLEDWPLAAAHELGHYLLFLFDTYLSIVEENNQTTVEEVDSCAFSAMGWFYEVENRHFIGDPLDWQNCEQTVANQELGRPEWNVIDDWYPWVVSPTAYLSGPVAPPIQLTTVTFVDPPPTSTDGLIGTTSYTLNYNDVMTTGASIEARGYLIRDENRAIDQGAPAEDATQLELMGAKEGDRFCVIDINENVDEEPKMRFHYGCEAVESGDAELFLEEDRSWAPIIDPIPTGPTSWQVTVTGVTSTLPLSATFYPEGGTNAQSLTFEPSGDMTATGTITLAEVTPAAYIELMVTSDDDLETNPARRAIVDYGIGGGSMWPGSHWGNHAPIYSPDGTVEFYRRTSITLGPDQFVAVVRYLNTYPLPENAIGASVPYGIVAWPPTLVQEGLINFRITQSQFGQSATAAAIAEEVDSATKIVLHHWTGNEWEPLRESRFHSEPDGERLVSANSRGAGIYVAIELPANQPGQERLYLPVVQ